jgi:hypothetical protein
MCLGSVLPVVLFRGGTRDDVSAGEPTAEVHIGATRAAEGPIVGVRGAAAGGAKRWPGGAVG